MQNCPICGSCDVESNKIEDEIMATVLHAGQTAHHTRFHLGVWAALAAVGIMKVANAGRSAYRCISCDRHFD